PQRITNELTSALRRFRGETAKVRQPIALVSLNARDPMIRQAIDEGAITEADLQTPPTDKAGAIDLARKLGLTSVLVGTVDTYTEAADKTSASVEVTLFEYGIPDDPAAEPTVARTISKNIKQVAHTDREKALLRTGLTERAALHLAAALLDAPGLQPPEPAEQAATKAKKGPGNVLWIVLGVLAAVGGIFAISSIGGGGSKSAGGLGVTGVRAVSEANSVRVTWTANLATAGYNVYRRGVGNQPIRSRQAAGFTLLPNPGTNSQPTVQGGAQTSFIDTTAVNGVIYEYAVAVAGVGPNREVGPISATSNAARAGANIGDAPALAANGGNGFVSLSWTASSAFVTGYIVFRRQGGVPDTGINSPDQLVRLGNVLQFDDTTVQNDLPYTYVVQPVTAVNVNQLLTGNDSNAVTVQGSATARPQAPRSVNATVDASGRVFLSWLRNPESNIDMYEILRRRDRSRSRRPTGRSEWLRGIAINTRAETTRSDPRGSRQIDLTGFTLVGTADATLTAFTDGPLPDGTYTFAVRAVDNAGQRGPATAASPVTVNAALAAPSGLRAAGLDRMVRLAWQPVAGDVSAYSIYRSQTPIGPAQTSPATAPGIARVGQVPSNQLTFDDLQLTNNATFYYAVTSVDSQGVESDFGKGDSPDTGVLAIPHTSPTQMTFTVDKQNLSGNGKATCTALVEIRDASDVPVGGVQVDLTTDRGTFVKLPATAQQLDTIGRQIRGMTDLAGQLKVDLQSDVVTAAGSQLSVNLQARAPELPDNIELQSQTVAFLASRPNVIILQPGQSQLVADNASTTNVTATVLDALGQPVPDPNVAAGFAGFHVAISLTSTNGALRAAGNVQNFPFHDGPWTETILVTDGKAVAVYRAGTDASTLGNPPANVITLGANMIEDPAVASQTLITLIPGTPAQVIFLDAGVQVQTVALGVTGSGTLPTSKKLKLVARDARGNAVRAGIQVSLAVQPTGLVTAPSSGTTDKNGEIEVTITSGADPGGAVMTATIAGTQVQSQLAITVQ
ncbi:MAG: hypothetical protein HYU66_16970, partial [Armatimonadetes bacterium]|nr:hypothetical protein [Armatimonadota bacterium]